MKLAKLAHTAVSSIFILLTAWISDVTYDYGIFVKIWWSLKRLTAIIISLRSLNNLISLAF